ncbi:MAG: helix-turn-helix transcriptional regulator [Acidimicrobiales bacterium]
MDGRSPRFDVSLVELGRRVDELSAATTRAQFDALIARELTRLAAEAGAAGVALAITAEPLVPTTVFTAMPDQQALAESIVDELDAMPAFRDVRASRRAVVPIRLDTPELGDVLARWRLRAALLVPVVPVVPGFSYLALVFDRDDGVDLHPEEQTALSMRVTVLISRALRRLAEFEWRSVLDSVEAERRPSAVLRVDPEGNLEKWPFALVGDGGFEEQVHPDDRGQVRYVLESIRTGSTDAYNLRVRVMAGRDDSSVQMVVRSAPHGGIEGIVIPPSPQVQVLPAPIGERLSPREREVVSLLLSGRRVRGIAAALFISEHTVRNHLKRIYAALDVESHTELVELIDLVSSAGTAELN